MGKLWFRESQQCQQMPESLAHGRHRVSSTCLPQSNETFLYFVRSQQYDGDQGVSTLYKFCHCVLFHHDSLPHSLPFTFYVLWARRFSYQVFEVTSNRPGKLSGALTLGKYRKPVALRSRIKRSKENHCVISPDYSRMPLWSWFFSMQSKTGSIPFLDTLIVKRPSATLHSKTESI